MVKKKEEQRQKDIDIVAAGHTCLDLIPAFTIDGKVVLCFSSGKSSYLYVLMISCKDFSQMLQWRRTHSSGN